MPSNYANMCNYSEMAIHKSSAKL